MLIFARKVGESFVIADGENKIVVKVLACASGRNVKIGIEAPKEVAVHRQEIYEKIQAGKVEDAS